MPIFSSLAGVEVAEEFVVVEPPKIMLWASKDYVGVETNFRVQTWVQAEQKRFFINWGGGWIERGRGTLLYQVSTQDMLNLLTPQL